MHNKTPIASSSEYSYIQKVLSTFEGLSQYLLIFGLAGGAITNVLLYYLGIHNNAELRAALFIIISVVIFCMAGIRFLQIYLTALEYRRHILFALIFPACGILIFCGAFAVFGKGAYRSIDLLMQFGCFCIPSFIFGLDCALSHREPNLFTTFDAISFFYIPFALLGILSILTSNNISGKMAIGTLNYMNIAYTLLLPLGFLVINTVLLPQRTSFDEITNHKAVSDKVSWAIYAGLALFFWYVILNTGTRGAMMAVFGVLAFLIIWTAYIRKKELFLRTIKVFLVFALLFSLFMIISSSSAANRTKLFVDGILHGRFQTSTTQAVSRAGLEEIIRKPVLPNYKSTESNHKDNIVNTDPSKVAMNREQLYTAAIGEFSNSPIFGIGPMGFYVKYDRYVHNIILEVLCDYGIVGALLFFGIIFRLLVRFMKLAKTSSTVTTMLAILIFKHLCRKCIYIIWFRVENSQPHS
jgi:O-antigen ligase